MAAREVAKYIDSEHHEYDFNFENAFERLEELIFTIESYDNTTIMASMPNYLLATMCRIIRAIDNRKRFNTLPTVQLYRGIFRRVKRILLFRNLLFLETTS